MIVSRETEGVGLTRMPIYAYLVGQHPHGFASSDASESYRLARRGSWTSDPHEMQYGIHREIESPRHLETMWRLFPVLPFSPNSPFPKSPIFQRSFPKCKNFNLNNEKILRNGEMMPMSKFYTLCVFCYAEVLSRIPHIHREKIPLCKPIEMTYIWNKLLFFYDQVYPIKCNYCWNFIVKLLINRSLFIK